MLIAHHSTYKLLYHKKRNHQKNVRQNNTVEEETRKRRHTCELETLDIDKLIWIVWRNAGQTGPETTWFMISIQGQVFSANNCEKYTSKYANATIDICKKFRRKSGAIQHVTLQVVR
jgi:hypothetical protein